MQFAAASFVTGKYVNDTAAILNVGWLPLKERRGFSLLKLVFKAMNYNTWSSYLKLHVVNNCRNPQSSASKKLTIPLEKGTFQDSAPAFFITYCKDYNEYCKLTKAFLKDRAIKAN